MGGIQEFARVFRSMNTDVLAIVNTDLERQKDAEAALARVQALFEESEAVMSRFRPESELSRLNHSAGQPFDASPRLFEVVSDAISAASATDGVFDPTVLRAMIDAGYDRSFDEISAMSSRQITASTGGGGASTTWGPAGDLRRQASGSTFAATRRAPGWSQIQLNRSTRTILLPPDVGFDLGGICKGWMVDRAADLLRPLGNFAVDAGGDLYAGGYLADGGPWTIGVQDPFFLDRDMLTLAVRDRAVATSTIMRRRWSLDGRPQHHLIDPRTGHPSESGVALVTVLAESVASAEVMAKAALLMGPAAGKRFLEERRSLDWIMVTTEGKCELSPGIREALYEA